MGLSDDIRSFIDESYSGFEGFPEQPGTANSGNDAADLWGGAFGSAFASAISPSSAAGLIDPGSDTQFVTNLRNAMATQDLPDALDTAASQTATAVQTSSSAAAAVAPASSLASSSNFMKGLELDDSSESIGKQIADKAQERFGEWIVTGKFTAFAASTAPVPNTKWGDAPPDPDEEEDD